MRIAKDSNAHMSDNNMSQVAQPAARTTASAPAEALLHRPYLHLFHMSTF